MYKTHPSLIAHHCALGQQLAAIFLDCGNECIGGRGVLALGKDVELDLGLGAGGTHDGLVAALEVELDNVGLGQAFTQFA